jgi:hypothetical protein
MFANRLMADIVCALAEQDATQCYGSVQRVLSARSIVIFERFEPAIQVIDSSEMLAKTSRKVASKTLILLMFLERRRCGVRLGQFVFNQAPKPAGKTV